MFHLLDAFFPETEVAKYSTDFSMEFKTRKMYQINNVAIVIYVALQMTSQSENEPL